MLTEELDIASEEYDSIADVGELVDDIHSPDEEDAEEEVEFISDLAEQAVHPIGDEPSISVAQILDTRTKFLDEHFPDEPRDCVGHEQHARLRSMIGAAWSAVGYEPSFEEVSALGVGSLHASELSFAIRLYYRMVQGHAFVNANKRTAWATLVYLLRRCVPFSYDVDCTHEEADLIGLDVENGHMTLEEVVEWLIVEDEDRLISPDEFDDKYPNGRKQHMYGDIPVERHERPSDRVKDCTNENCTNRAEGYWKIRKMFGYRKAGQDPDFRTPQPQCGSCRRRKK